MAVRECAGPGRELADLSRTRQVLRTGMAHGWHGAAAVHVADLNGVGRTVAIGRTLDGTELCTDGLVPWFCAAKPLLMLVAARLVAGGALSFDDPVSRYVPGFGRGKEAATVRHVLTHSIGLRKDPVELFGLETALAVRTICRAPAEPGWQPGREHSYLPFTGWYLIGEILRRCTGQDLAALVRAEVLAPLELTAHIAMSPREYRSLRPALVPVGTRQVRVGPGRHEFRLPIDGPEVCCRPGPMSVRGTLADLARLYGVLARHDDPPLGIPADFWRACVRRPAEPVFDHRHQVLTYLGPGLKFEGRHLSEASRVFGPACGPDTVGHRGLGSLVAYADPDADVAVAAFFDVTQQPLVNRGRIDMTSAAVYEDLGIA